MNKGLIIITVLIISLLFSSTSIGFTNSYTDIEHNQHQDAILEMSRLGILEGVGNNQFAPNAELNRAAAAKVAGYLLGYTEEDAKIAAQSPPKFNDIVGTNHGWALGWINLMADEGVLNGIGDGQYGPGDPLKMVQWVTILIRILQHEQANMSWPEDYNDMAYQLGMDRGLYYGPTSTMNRAEMARMSTTALYNIQRPDGQKIIDLVIFAQEPKDEWDVPEQPEPNIYTDAEINIKLSNTVIPTGGGQTVTITVTASYGSNNLPDAFTEIGFVANSGQHNRLAQLSADTVLTDANGVASVTYTTLPGDDNLMLEFLANIHTNNEWIDRRGYALVSNSAVFLSGTVINPFTGGQVSELTINADTDSGTYLPIATDEQGNYSSPVNVGTYFVNYSFNIGDTSPYPGEYRGSHFSINNNGDVWISIQKTFTDGNSYILPSEMGIVTGTTKIAPGTDIYIGMTDTKIATIGADGRFMIALVPGTYSIGNRVGTILKSNIVIQKGRVTDVGHF